MTGSEAMGLSNPETLLESWSPNTVTKESKPCSGVKKLDLNYLFRWKSEESLVFLELQWPCRTGLALPVLRPIESSYLVSEKTLLGLLYEPEPLPEAASAGDWGKTDEQDIPFHSEGKRTGLWGKGRSKFGRPNTLEQLDHRT